MNAHVSFPCGLMLLLLIQVQVQARPRTGVDSLQILSRLLEDEYGPYLSSEDSDMEAEEASRAGTLRDLNLDQADMDLLWDRDARDIGGRSFQHDGLLLRLLKDLTISPLRFNGRSKKGPSRGCFGVKLDRIGAMSGLGC
ncbi:C-type natriuretic peptide prohormone-like [Callorhinchus milii]|uniref:C-type natriuretic peptide n=2 Tax=Callorhinchus milii TaxID=7868 RepID=Q2PF87_CALMI|nr:C-type natriuretic peptide prohormone-like [Callorhinchus milii]BAE75880.1 C-type natriuretic peptide precursor [Callorhinchus milii]